MNLLGTIVLFAWPVVVLALFATLPARRALLAAFLGGWMFLPMGAWELPIVAYSKTSITPVAALIAALLLDGPRFARCRFRWPDVGMLAWCLVPIASSISAGYGPKEGFSAAIARTIVWGLPYLLGRVYFTNLAEVRELAVALFIGGLVYTPLCLFEIRFSPQLHTWIYGFQQYEWVQGLRGGGYRPLVFMQHGLAVGMFMTSAALVGFWLWWTGAVRQLMGVPMWLLVGGVMVTAVLCKSTGATLLMLMGCGVLVAIRVAPMRVIAVALLLMPIGYIGLRTVGGWSGRELVEFAAMISPERAHSVDVRLTSEDGMWELMRPQLLLGAERFTFAGAEVPSDETDDDTPARRVIPDGMWVIALGCNGLVGLAAFLSALQLPFGAVIWRVPARLWSHPNVSACAVLVVMLGLYTIDCLFNAMINPLMFLSAGAVVSVAFGVARPRPVRTARPPSPKRPDWRETLLGMQEPSRVP